MEAVELVEAWESELALVSELELALVSVSVSELAWGPAWASVCQ